MARNRVLLAENDRQTQSTIGRFFVDSGLHVQTVDNGFSAYEELVGDHFDLVVSELDLPKMNGLDLMKRIREFNDALPVILISENAKIEEAVKAIKLGAKDFLAKPLTLQMIECIVSQISNGSKGKGNGGANKKHTIITTNGDMTHLMQEARDMADSRASIFIHGESGTGKELFARFIHRHSPRRHSSFVAINCAALPENLLESELFGHEKGSFTGALSRKKGKFELAHHGTILLDEISEMDIQLQSKLLRVLQEREIDTVGGVRPVPVDVRVIATTNRDIEIEIKEGRFRADLYYRLNVIPFQLPPLRERRDDIPLLTKYFLDKYNRIDSRSVKGVKDEALHMLVQMPWRGNVRELENVVERAVLRCKGEMISAEDLLISEKNRQVETSGYPPRPTVSLKEVEKKAILNALDKTKGNRTHAAEILGISVRTLRNKLNEYRKNMEVN